METPQKKANRQARLEVTRKMNSLIVNMTKTSGIIYALAGCIENDEAHLEDDVKQAVAFIDQQVDMINHAKLTLTGMVKDSIVKSVEKTDSKTKKDA